jgi:UDP:flavonoid glycosyltransferase YjiC (YdhE family)
LPPNLPETVRHFDYVPFSALLPRAAALVHHGGIGTLSQGFAAGVPQLIMPMSHDQPDNAARARRLGVGGSLSPRTFRGPAVAGELSRLLESREVHACCRELAGRLAVARPLDSVCDVIEALAAATADRGLAAVNPVLDGQLTSPRGSSGETLAR